MITTYTIIFFILYNALLAHLLLCIHSQRKDVLPLRPRQNMHFCGNNVRMFIVTIFSCNSSSIYHRLCLSACLLICLSVSRSVVNNKFQVVFKSYQMLKLALKRLQECIAVQSQLFSFAESFIKYNCLMIYQDFIQNIQFVFY